MAKDQSHGKQFENIVKASGFFLHSTIDAGRSPIEMFDIERKFDNLLDYPTSVKTCNRPTSVETYNGAVPLSDARNFWKSFDFAPYRLLVGLYNQTEHKKSFYEIHEFILVKKDRAIFFNDVSFEEIESFHNSIHVFPRGKHAEARNFAQKLNSELKPKLGIINLNPKIDSKSQRRLQCSAKLANMLRELPDPIIHTRRFGTLPLPIIFISSERAFSGRKNKQE